ncbi:MAG: alpha/beta hydrolase [Rhodovulum sulfidophilum]|uniref:Alpha/beta hydrolase n=1 Tax=Rhodovulum sulfidophilum TaxID=35806 RepID=A0A2W5MW27_RHOSU|nr:MAG: alpha/beta hydrolase [Rhodovulum sulfidophilum]
MPGGAKHVVTPDELARLLPELRRAWAAAPPQTSEVRAVPVECRRIPGPAGAPDVPILIVGAPGGAPRPAILHMHGGGFIVGTAEEYLPMLRAEALALGARIVSVDYRLAPEAPFPGALEDNYAALLWLHAEAETLGIDRERIALQGESAGGGHAAMLALAARDRGEVPVMFQCLTYPMLDDRTGSARAVAPHIGTWGWTAQYNRMGWSALLGVPAGSAHVPEGAVPARAADLAGLPPAFLWVGSLDLFVEENLAYAARLAVAGVPVELHLVPGVYHGFDGAAPASSVTLGYRDAMVMALARAFAVVPRPDFARFLV